MRVKSARIRRLGRGAVLLLAMAGIATAQVGDAAAGSFTYDNPKFCAPGNPVRDFGLLHLPPVREPPESAKGLGYGAVDIWGGWPRVMPEATSFGYQFSEHSYTDEGVRLNWRVTAQLWAISRNGAGREVDQRKLTIGRLRGAQDPGIYLDPPRGRLGFYRFDMQIANQGGKAIGSYSSYFKVVLPTSRPKLGLSHDAVRPGERLLIRLENYGSETVSYAEPFSVQRLESGRWVRDPDLTRHRWLKWLGLLGPGGTGRCGLLVLPADTPPGSYRIVKTVGTERWPDGKQESLRAPFVVLDPGAEVEY